jgi:excisionase family DNA binding protein
MSDPIELLTTKEAATQLRVSPSVIHKLRSQGALPYVRVGRKVFFEPSMLTRYIEKQRRIDVQENDNDE